MAYRVTDPPHRAAQAPPGIGAKERSVWRFILRTREEADRLCDAIRGAKIASPIVPFAATTDTDPCAFCNDSRDRRVMRRGGAAERCTSRTPATSRGVRADGALSATGIRRTSQDQGAAARVGQGGVAEVIHQSERRGKPRRLPREAAQTAGRAGDPHCHGRAGRQRPRVCGRGDDAQVHGRPAGSIVSSVGKSLVPQFRVPDQGSRLDLRFQTPDRRFRRP